MPKKIGVVLAGCGVLDGSEIHEAVLTLLALDRHGVEAVVCAPDVEQTDVVDHLTGQVERGSRRNVLAESARIARGRIGDVAKLSADQLDGLILPGGSGAAKNLSDFAVKGQACVVQPQVARLVREVHAQGKPVAALCIAPALLAKVLGSEAPRLTIGNDPGTAAALEAMGAEHVACPATEAVVDRQHRLITSPAYMLARRITEVADGIEKTVAALVEMA